MTPSEARLDCPPITVVIPTHQRPELMRQAVESVLNQRYRAELEVIVVFDACPVELPAVDVPDHRTLRGVANDRSRGLAGARNTGILAAEHDLVAFLDDDDHWLPGKLERQAELIAHHPDAILYGTAMEVHTGSRVHERLLPSGQVTHQDLLGNRMAPLHSSSFLIRRDRIVNDVGLVSEEIPRSYCEDYDLLLRVARYAPIPVANEPLVAVRWQGSSHFVGTWAAYAAAYEWLLDQHPEFRARRTSLARIEARIAFALAASGERRRGAARAARAIRGDPRVAKAWLALAVASRMVSADRVVRILRRFGRGI